ncbi:4-diphosphocytidyl-2-C-methyl-D-erythritol kinase [Aminobacter aminovorans]|uniref:4-diphosphocytidyl-2-C-methyl-D-erythritol kinase n=1 Tax=Aminobacter aminovorans TaxID=83263 RepID=A0A380WQV0_AMIAI|nr:4-(cytidine 5'-diphospho)-2-C-methyl-D-erythritol kinase [Aminobacter aminovorans]TCS30389.1 4-diphosphocytidyl-2-C-methyl-D-erythritol kinase [Aminobacter aminovorans]SUU91238.1 4-diphosphocytidyl-2-C-methyl-D-erythritol kinase [Aminobacter aminovorans]
MTFNSVPLAELAPAKINLALHVTGRRHDGYHLLESLVVFAELGDRITVAAAAEESFVVDGPFATDVPVDGGNLVLKARDALRTAFPQHTTQPVAIALEKNLPVASGIGGGSSDAAAALRALSRLWRLPADASELARLALPLGADLPMCLAGHPLIARGIGEQLDPVRHFPCLPMVLVNPGIAVATPSVFQALKRRENPPLAPLDSADTVLDWLTISRNDLEPPAISVEPSIAEVLAALRSSGASFARMSGSGATCFGIFDGNAAAARAAAAISAEHPGWFSAATTTRT